MSECSLAGGCAFFLAGRMDVRSEQLKRQYCAAGGVGCARRSVGGRIGADKLPHDLLPNDAERAYDLIREPALTFRTTSNGVRRLERTEARA